MSRASMEMPKNLRGALALASCSLLGAAIGAGNAQAADGDWQVDTALLYYAEQGRVSAVEPEVTATHDLGDEKSFSVKVVLDGLTGPSPNGAEVQAYPQTFTTPSGESQYTVAAGDVPLDEQFHDTRGALSLNWTAPLENRLWKRSLGANLSSEFDFLSLGVNGALSRDFNKRNTTLTGGLSFEQDAISPVGGTPIPFAQMGPGSGTGKAGGGGESRSITDVLLGVTQVISPRMLMQFNVDLSLSSGYMNDPYKIVTVDNGFGAPGTFVYENRPDTRSKQSLFWETKYGFDRGDVIDASYRYMTDDWGIASSTVDLRYRRVLPENWYVEPHVRWYDQGAADFYTTSVLPADIAGHVGDKSLAYSADYRLGALTDTTFGVRVGKRVADNGDAYVRLESMTQSGDTKQADVSALIFELGYSRKW